MFIYLFITAITCEMPEYNNGTGPMLALDDVLEGSRVVYSCAQNDSTISMANVNNYTAECMLLPQQLLEVDWYIIPYNGNSLRLYWEIFCVTRMKHGNVIILVHELTWQDQIEKLNTKLKKCCWY